MIESLTFIKQIRQGSLSVPSFPTPSTTSQEKSSNRGLVVTPGYFLGLLTFSL